MALFNNKLCWYCGVENFIPIDFVQRLRENLYKNTERKVENNEEEQQQEKRKAEEENTPEIVLLSKSFIIKTDVILINLSYIAKCPYLHNQHSKMIICLVVNKSLINKI